jgi:hypothetical protein
VTSVTFTDNGRKVGVDKTGPVYSVAWKTGTLKKGTHHLAAKLVDAAGHAATAGRNVRVCK